jgi:hypothetical protein
MFNIIFVLFTSEHSVIEYLMGSPKRVDLFLPTMEFNRELLKNYESEDDKHTIQMSREKLLTDTAEMKYPRFLFRSYAQLESILERLICPIK